MKKNLLIFAFVLCMLPATLYAQGQQFTVSLSVGSTLKAEIIKLQEFLVTLGLLNVAPTGNYLSLTKDAVMAFQKNENISPIGVFGPLTRVAANSRLAVVPKAPATIGITDITQGNNGVAAIFLSSSKKIKWQTTGDYPTTAGVNINLLKKTSESPVVYELVRQIAKDTPNDGEEVWIANSGETGHAFYIEVTCSSTQIFSNDCQISGVPMKVQ